MILYYLLMFLLALFIIKWIYNCLRAIVLRIILYIKLAKVCKNKGYIMEKTRFILASFFKYSPKPDIIIRANDIDYIVRVITCRARKRIYHFVNHEWFVRVFRYYILTLAFHSGTPVTLSKSCKHLPPIDEKYLQHDGRKKQVVLLFNPSPLDITFTTRANRREIGTNGADFDGWVIYNAREFVQKVKAD